VKATEKLHELGQSLWLDNITRELLDSGQLQTYIDDYSVTGLTSNPSIFDKAIASGGYDDAIHEKASTGMDREALFFERLFACLPIAAEGVHADQHGIARRQIPPCTRRRRSISPSRRRSRGA